jgi:glycosyltransferase involved in cell wall biosynthesis
MQFNFLTILFYLFLLAAGIQVLYWLFFLIGLARLSKSGKGKSDATEGISIIVAARNEIENLKLIIPSLLNQNHSDFEVIIVNDRSDDGSDEFLIDEEKKFEKLKALHIYDLPEHISAKKYAITLGIKAATNKQVLLTDADCIPSSDSWIAEMASGFKGGKDIVLGFSTYKKLPGFLNYFIRFETLLTGIEYLASAANKLPYMGVGRNLAYKKDLFLENKGFFGYQETIGGDDDIFINKHSTSRNTEVVISKDAITISNPKTTFKEFWRQKIRHLHVGKAYSFKSKVTLAFFNLSWIFTWILGAYCIIIGNNWQYVAYGLLLREIIMLSSFLLVTKKSGISFGMAGIVFVDILYVIYYIFVGTKAIIVKNISWA